MKKFILLIFFFFFKTVSFAQVGINTTNPEAQLEIKSSNQALPSNTDGLLIPKIDTFPATNPTVAQQGMLVYLTTAVGVNQPGFYFWENTTTNWKPITGATSAGTLDQAYDFGGAGLGKTITADAGAVLIDGTDGFVSTGSLNMGAVTPSGAGNKMFWNPRKAAFRSGLVSGTQWDNTNVGYYSTAFGLHTIASQTSSTAFGSSTTASGIVSTAFGSYTIASGFVSTAFGRYTTASGYGSTTFGSNTVASATYSSAFGDRNTAFSYGETVFGIGATNYTPSTDGQIQFATANATDRLFVIGNAIDSNTNGNVDSTERSDAMIVLKNGLTRLPSTTNAMITAADGKAVVTKEYLQTNTSGTLDQAYDFGGAGLGKTITADAGAVLIDGTDGLVSTGTLNSGALAPYGVGTGVRMVWNPRKAAFRAGCTLSLSWSDDNIGVYSTAFGLNTTASGSRAFACGSFTIASADFSTAFGQLTTASGQRSTAFGTSTLASGEKSTSFGRLTEAVGVVSTSFGDHNFAKSYGETVIGIGATDYTPSSNGALQFGSLNTRDRLFVIGNAIDVNNDGNVDNPERSDAMIVLKNGLTRLPSTTNAMITAADGKAVVTKEYLQSNISGTLDQAYDFGGAGLGKTITADAGAVLINGTDGFVSTGTGGTGAIAPSGAGVKMFWNPRKAAFRAGNSSATSWDDVNIGQYSTAFGLGTTASGSGSTAYGFFTTASGYSSTAYGYDTTASGIYSTTYGYGTTASGGNTSVFGRENTASSYGETVLGIGATNYTPSTNGATQFRTANATDRLFVIGNAIDANSNNAIDVAERSDAIVVLKNGNTGIGTNNPSQKLEVAPGNIEVTQGDIYLGAGNGVFNAGGGIMSATINYIGDAFVAPTQVNGDEDLYIGDDLELGGQGYKPGGGLWVAPSDRRLKQNIQPYVDGLESLLRINPVTYKYNSVFKTLDTGETYVGVIAQEVQEIAPYMIKEKPFGQLIEEDENGTEKIVNQGTPYLTFDGSALTYMLINAMKELNVKNEELKTKNEELDNKLNMLLLRIEKLENK